jgi:serine/threonine protein kinase
MSTQLPASASGAPSAGVDAHDGDDVQLDSAIDAMIDEVTEGQIVSEPPPPRAPIVGGESDADESPLARQGEVLAQRYVIKRLLAKGGMGRVYLATQTPLGREVAVKCLIPQPNDKEFRKRFFLEASTCARLTHRHIVTVHDYGEADNGELFMAMEYLRGEPLSRVIAREGRLSSERTGRIALQIARALRAAHKIGVVHRDLKPGNIMLLRDEDQDVADFIKVLDFGLVKAYSAVDGVELDAGDLTRAGTWLGSPRYMAPEQIRCREVDPRTDIYSLGAIIYHMLAGRPPFTGATSVEIFGQHLRDAVPWIRELSGASEVAPELEVVVRRCLEKEPDRRYQSLDELMADLKAALRLIAGVSAMGEATMGHVLDPAEHSVPPGVARMMPQRSIKPSHHSLEALAQEALGPTSDSGIGPAGPLSVPPLASEPPRARASQVPRPTPAPLPSRAAEPELSGAREPWPVPSQPPVTRRLPVVPIVLGLGLGLVLLYALVLRSPSAPPVATTPAGPAPITLVSQPPGAEVTLDGALLGRTPLEYRGEGRALGDRLRFELTLEGHARRVVEAELSRSPMSLTAALEPLPAVDVARAPVGEPGRATATDPAVTAAARRSPEPTRRPEVARRPSPTPSRRAAPEPTVEPTPSVSASPSPSASAASNRVEPDRRISVDDDDQVPVVGGVPTVE